MSQLTLENNTNNALKVDLATLIQGEDTDNNWMKTNAQGCLQAAGDRFNVSTTAVERTLVLKTQVVSIYNPGPATIWASFDGSTPVTQAPSVPIPAGLTLTLPLATEENLKFIGEAAVVGVTVVVLGNEAT